MKDVPVMYHDLREGDCLYVPAFWWSQSKTMAPESKFIEFDYSANNQLYAAFMLNVLNGQFIDDIV